MRGALRVERADLMLPYWLFFLLPAIVAFQAAPINRRRTDGTRATTGLSTAWYLVMVGLTLIIGLRYEVGGDWNSYLRYLYGARYLSFSDLATVSDPGYWALNMLSSWLGLGMAGVNTISALLFASGLIVFCRSLPRPWLALSCAMPYLVTVVAMGYTRQAIAVSLAMIGIVALQRVRYIRFAAWILVAALFHKTAIVLIPLAALVVKRKRFKAVGFIGLFSFAAYEAILSDHVDQLTSTYQDANLESSGALIRLAMNAVPAVLLLMFHKRFALSPVEKRLWIIVSIISIGMFIGFFLTNLSTALDRMALYLIPLQLVVFAHFPDAIGRPGGRNEAIVASILLYYATVLFVWLNFAQHSGYWVPYRMGLA